MRSIIVTAALLVSLCASATPVPPRGPLFGLAMPSPNSAAMCVVFSGGKAAPGDYVSIIIPARHPRVLQARVGRPLDGACEFGDLMGEVFELVHEPLQIDATDIAVVTDGWWPSIRAAGESVWELPGETSLTLRRCASTEGLHFSAWTAGRRVWHEYFYLGYDVDPTCSEAESAD
jgi:hypothetical protein